MNLELFHTITIIECNAEKLYKLLKKENIHFVSTPTNQNYLIFQFKCTSTKLFKIGFLLGEDLKDDEYFYDTMCY